MKNSRKRTDNRTDTCTFVRTEHGATRKNRLLLVPAPTHSHRRPLQSETPSEAFAESLRTFRRVTTDAPESFSGCFGDFLRMLRRKSPEILKILVLCGCKKPCCGPPLFQHRGRRGNRDHITSSQRLSERPKASHREATPVMPGGSSLCRPSGRSAMLCFFFKKDGSLCPQCSLR